MNELGNSPADKNYKPSGISRAESRAREAYPNEHFVDHTYAEMCRGFYEEGYEQAEKDLALTWEDVQLLDHFVLELVREEKEGKDWGDGKEFYTEVLTRFKQFKEEQQ